MTGTARLALTTVLLGFVGFLLVPVDAAAPSSGDGVELKTVKYSELTKAVREQRGKVVVIDVWADFCIPCKQEFHNLVELHQQYSGKGLVCMSVALDPAEEDKEGTPPPGIKKFLVKQKAAFANYWLNEEPKVWQERWHIQGPPAVFVFDRQGRRAARFDSEDPDKPLKYEAVKKLIADLLAQAP